MNILVVDDQTGILRSINKLLSRLGHTCRLILDPNEALLRYMEEPSEVVICDYMMPGMDGGEFLRRMLESDPTAKVIIMSGFAKEAETRRFIEDGAYAFLDKPLDIEELLRLLREIERKKAQA